ncbi:MAG: 4Fe-4S binding protein [Lachnospiraceae bacterium]
MLGIYFSGTGNSKYCVEQLVREAKIKLVDAACRLKNGKPTRDGLGFLAHLAGLFGQRLWFYNKTKNYSDRLKIDTDKCVGCEQCTKLCPMENLVIKKGKAYANGTCTLCYRCISNCPKQAITLLGNTVHEQSKIEKYL